ncbi:MAG: hypothetical protein CVU00_14070 [Bacteroidetes bacterium HGW-Bacteroidetes-17]|nr:MAG: hypothetical protein CVU00_14070 [Bacteroidetes bacterium HGW-Bacteroidetes-17]
MNDGNQLFVHHPNMINQTMFTFRSSWPKAFIFSCSEEFSVLRLNFVRRQINFHYDVFVLGTILFRHCYEWSIKTIQIA